MSAHDTLPALPLQDGVTFRHCPGWPGYCVGDDGSVWSCHGRVGRGRGRPFVDKWRRLKTTAGHVGHLRVGFCRNEKHHLLLVHRLVLEAFVGPCPEGMECCHFPDHNPGNNHLANLRWGTKAENMSHKRIHGTLPPPEKRMEYARNASRYSAAVKRLFTPDQVREIRRLASEGVKRSELRRRFGMKSTSAMRELIVGETYADVE